MKANLICFQMIARDMPGRQLTNALIQSLPRERLNLAKK